MTVCNFVNPIDAFLGKLPNFILCTASAAKSDTRTRAIFCLAAKKAPYNVYGNPFYEYAGHGNVFSVDENGALKENIQNYEYSPESAIHGMVFDAEENYLYSADMWGNKVWTHKKDSQTGLLELVGKCRCVEEGRPS